MLLETGAPYEAALAAAAPTGPWQAREPQGDDLIFLYTGGTTGMPKGVMWRNDDLYLALWQSTPTRHAAGRSRSRRHAPASAPGSSLPACPLMHGTGLFIALSTLAGASTVVLIEEVGLDPDRVWFEVERNRVDVLTIVGDVFARPLLGVLDAEPGKFDLSSLPCDHVVGRDVLSRRQGRADGAPSGRDDHRLARIVRGDHDPLGSRAPSPTSRRRASR